MTGLHMLPATFLVRVRRAMYNIPSTELERLSNSCTSAYSSYGTTEVTNIRTLDATSLPRPIHLGMKEAGSRDIET